MDNSYKIYLGDNVEQLKLNVADRPQDGRFSIFKNKEIIFKTLGVFKNHLRSAIESVKNKPPDKQVVFVKSWNEWAEGNYLEPDRRWGKGFLEAIREVLSEYKEK